MATPRALADITLSRVCSHGSSSSKHTSLTVVRERVRRMVIATVAGLIATKRGACLRRGPKGILWLVIGRDWQVYAIGLYMRVEVRHSVTLL